MASLDTIHYRPRKIIGGCLCAQENKEGKERALYYLSRTLVRAEFHYSPIEKMYFGSHVCGAKGITCKLTRCELSLRLT